MSEDNRVTCSIVLISPSSFLFTLLSRIIFNIRPLYDLCYVTSAVKLILKQSNMYFYSIFS